MSTPPPPSRGKLKRLAAARPGNLRQLVLRTSRVLNAEIVDELVRRGYDIRATHTTLLSNLDASGNSISNVAGRAGMTKQAMGRIADELEAAGFIASANDPADRRSRVVRFTATGWKLMLESFAALDRIERRYAKRMGAANLNALRIALRSFLAAAERDEVSLDD